MNGKLTDTDVGRYRGLRNDTSVYAGIDLQPPLLNISSYFTSIGGALNNSGLIPSLNYSRWSNESGPSVDIANVRSWTTSSEHFTIEDIQENGICLPTKVQIHDTRKSLH
jgi:hypothetical protein